MWPGLQAPPVTLRGRNQHLFRDSTDETGERQSSPVSKTGCRVAGIRPDQAPRPPCHRLSLGDSFILAARRAPPLPARPPAASLQPAIARHLLARHLLAHHLLKPTTY